MALLVLGPAFIAFKQQGMDPHAAGIATWQLGMAALVIMGVLKFVLSFFGEAVTRALPRAALLGSIAGIALVLMGLLPLLETLRSPLVGFTTLGLLLYVLIAKGKLGAGVTLEQGVAAAQGCAINLLAQVKAALGDHAYKTVISSTKSMTGHLLGGAGGIESIFTVLALYNQKVPPTINLENQDPECDLDFCANTARDMKMDIAVKNNFGFGGTNGSLLFSKAD